MHDVVCQRCRKSFQASQASARLCGVACRVAQHRERREQERRNALALLSRIATADSSALASLQAEARRAA